MMSAFDHPWLSGLFADPDMAEIWSADTQLGHMLAFEADWSRAGHIAGLWSKDEGEAAAVAIEAVQISPVALAAGTARDGVCIPDLVKQLKSKTGLTAIHTGATSQDVIDTATVLSISATLDLLEDRIQSLQKGLLALDAKFGDTSLMGRTRMQAAVSIKVSDRLQGWYMPLADHLNRINDVRSRVCRVQVGGAAGNRAALGDGATDMVAVIAGELGLADTPKAWHSMRDGVAEFASVLSLISGTVGKIGQDICLMAQQGIDEITLTGGGGSSAMPHKQNPVQAELLVTLARFNAVQVSGMHNAMMSEQERSGAAWALEWLILPQMAQATGRGLAAAHDIVGTVTRIGTP